MRRLSIMKLMAGDVVSGFHAARNRFSSLAMLLTLGALTVAGGLTSAARANTIQPILMSVLGPVAGEYNYTFDLQLTPNDYLQNNSAAPTGLPSSLTILDFGVVSGTPTLSSGSGFIGPDVTSTSDWSVSTNLTGGAPLPDATYAGGDFILTGSNGVSAAAPDNATMSNITLEYLGSGLATNSSQRSLVQLHILSNIAPGTTTFQSLSLDGNPFTNLQQPDTYSVTTTLVPEPGSIALLGIGAVGMLRCRKRQMTR
jgi:hypothetical protein